MKISVVIPTYGRNPTTAMKSLLPLPFGAEVIIVDDASPNPIDIQQTDIIRLIRLGKNGGPGTARNFGLAFARGEYIVFLDSDDELGVGALKELLRRLPGSNVDVALMTLRQCKGSKVWDRAPRCASGSILDNTLIGKFLTMSPVDKVFRKKFLLDNNIYFPSIRGYEDVCFVRMVAAHLNTYISLPHLTYIAHLGENSISRNCKSNLESLKTVIYLSQSLSEFGSGRSRLVAISNARVILYEIHRFARRSSYKVFFGEYIMLWKLLEALQVSPFNLDAKYKFSWIIARSPILTYVLNKANQNIW